MGNELLFARVVSIANKKYDGHLTLFKFTTGWKGAFSTPDIRVGMQQVKNGEPHNPLDDAPGFRTLYELLEWMVATEPCFHADDTTWAVTHLKSEDNP